MKFEAYIVDETSEASKVALASMKTLLAEDGYSEDDIRIIFSVTEFGSDYKWHCKICPYSEPYPDLIVLKHLDVHKNLVIE